MSSQKCLKILVRQKQDISFCYMMWMCPAFIITSLNTLLGIPNIWKAVAIIQRINKDGDGLSLLFYYYVCIKLENKWCPSLYLKILFNAGCPTFLFVTDGNPILDRDKNYWSQSGLYNEWSKTSHFKCLQCLFVYLTCKSLVQAT